MLPSRTEKLPVVDLGGAAYIRGGNTPQKQQKRRNYITMTFKFVPLALALAALVSLGTPATLRAQDDEAGMAEKKPALKVEKKEKHAGAVPFQGTISATDANAMTVTLTGAGKERVITLNADTKITKDSADAKFEDLKAGEKIRGQIMKSEDGKEIAKSVMLGEKMKKEKKPKKEKATEEEMTEEKAE